MFMGSAQAMNLTICEGEFALCAASPATPTGKKIVINGKTFQEGMAVCPILKGKSIADLSLMNGSCDAPKGKVWSLFSTATSYPQAPDWAVKPVVVTKFVTTKQSGMSNMWSFLCEIQAKKINGVRLASCYGPINESPWNNGHVPVGSTAFTAAPVGAANPVGGNVPSK
jgi:hypothetical protein